MFSVLGGDGASPLVPTLLKTSSWGPLSLSTTPSNERRQLISRESCKSLWRNRLARSAVKRKVGGSSPPRDERGFKGPLIFPPMIQLWTLSVLDEQDNPNSTEERQGEGGLNLMMF
ncbi:unnamed protein product [Clavelina lepadiformis]|uniref:Uncharacterized protein n=1 Tax=Clavelina lepadiformis TaxID=159417 RepID=A0ABP0GHJ9_CLALP